MVGTWLGVTSLVVLITEFLTKQSLTLICQKVRNEGYYNRTSAGTPARGVPQAGGMGVVEGWWILKESSLTCSHF